MGNLSIVLVYNSVININYYLIFKKYMVYTTKEANVRTNRSKLYKIHTLQLFTKSIGNFKNMK